MEKSTGIAVVTVGLFALLSWAAGAADLGSTAQAPKARTGSDGAIWLYWDTGDWSTVLTYPAVDDAWWGNDYDIATISTYRHIESFRLCLFEAQMGPTFRGGHIGVFSYEGGAPGSLILGPKFVKGSVRHWNDFYVDWNLPAGADTFVAAWEQTYNTLNCDKLFYDRGPSRNHSWKKITTQDWSRWGRPSNLMVRVLVNDEHQAVAPASLGRIKALYQ